MDELICRWMSQRCREPCFLNKKQEESGFGLQDEAGLIKG